MIAKLIQYNILRGGNLRPITRFLKEQKPDIVTLQEVVEPVFHQVKEQLGYEGCFHPAVLLKPEDGNGRMGYGVALLSRYRILSWGATFLNGELCHEEDVPDSRFEPRTLLTAILDLGRVNLIASTTHLGYELGFVSSPFQQTQANAAVDFLDTIRMDVGRLFPGILDAEIFAGDLNALPGSETIQIFEAGEFVNIFQGKHIPTFASIPWKRAGFQVDTLAYQIDHVMMRGRGIRALEGGVVQVAYSDHLPVIASFEVSFEPISYTIAFSKTI